MGRFNMDRSEFNEERARVEANKVVRPLSREKKSRIISHRRMNDHLAEKEMQSINDQFNGVEL